VEASRNAAWAAVSPRSFFGLSALFSPENWSGLGYNGAMRRWLYIATFGLLLVSLPMWAQRHGGGAHASGGGFAGHSSSFSAGSFHGASFSHSSNGIRRQAGSSYYNRRPNYRSSFRRRLSYPYGLYYPYAGYYPWYGDGFDYQSDYQNQNDGQTADAYADSNYPGPYREDSGLQRDVQTLSGKIDRLQAEAEARNHPKTETEPATALVFRDQHVEEVHNYAIAGGTLWVLNDQAAKKIPLAQLDIPATVKMNDDRGVDFQVPGPALQLMIMR